MQATLTTFKSLQAGICSLSDFNLSWAWNYWQELYAIPIKDAVTGNAFSPEGQFMAVATEADQVEIRNSGDGTVIVVLDEQPQPTVEASSTVFFVSALSFSLDGTFLAVAREEMAINGPQDAVLYGQVSLYEVDGFTTESFRLRISPLE